MSNEAAQLLREGKITSDQYVQLQMCRENTQLKLQMCDKFAEIKKDQTEKLERAVSSLSQAVQQPEYDVSDESDTETRSALFGLIQKTNRTTKHRKRPNRQRMEWQQNMGNGILNMFQQDVNITQRGEYHIS